VNLKDVFSTIKAKGFPLEFPFVIFMQVVAPTGLRVLHLSISNEAGKEVGIGTCPFDGQGEGVLVNLWSKHLIQLREGSYSVSVTDENREKVGEMYFKVIKD